MASAAQIAARAKFGAMVKSGAFKKNKAAPATPPAASTPAANGKKNNTFKYIFGTLLGVAAIAGYAYWQGTKKTTQAELPPDDTSGQPIPQEMLLIIAEEMYNDIKGVNFFETHDTDVWQGVIAMGNFDFVRLYNLWNTKYQSKFSQTLTEAIRSESDNLNNVWHTIKETVLAKLAANNLK